jgi:hypothetical protein
VQRVIVGDLERRGDARQEEFVQLPHGLAERGQQRVGVVELT